jgi:hypothetical protein
MNVISNTGPIIAFAKLNRLDILVSLFSTVLIPPTVHRELMGRIGEECGAIEKGIQTFIKITEVPDVPRDTAVDLMAIDEGERQVISLAISVGPDALLLLDDKAGRTAAKQLGVRITGTVGLLLLAKERRLIPSVTEYLEALRLYGYWLSDEIIAVAIYEAGEKKYETYSIF